MKTGKSGNHKTKQVSLLKNIRNLPCYKCYINEDWIEGRYAFIFILRGHQAENLKMASFQIDFDEDGLEHIEYSLKCDEGLLLDTFHQLSQNEHKLVEIDYSIVHNIIYQAVAYMDEEGLPTPKKFELSQYFLQEDDNRIEYIPMEFGDEYPGGITEDEMLENINDHIELLKSYSVKEWKDYFKDKKELNFYEKLPVIEALYDRWKEKHLTPESRLDDSIMQSVALDNLFIHDYNRDYPAVKGDYLFLIETINEYFDEEEFENDESDEDGDYGLKNEDFINDEIAEKRLKYPAAYQFYHGEIYWRYRRGEHASCLALIDKVLEKFPTHTTAILDSIEYLADMNQLDKVKKILNNKTTLQELFPNQSTFSLREILTFYDAMILYSLRNGALSDTEKYYMAKVHFETLWDNHEEVDDEDESEDESERDILQPLSPSLFFETKQNKAIDYIREMGIENWEILEKVLEPEIDLNDADRQSDRPPLELSSGETSEAYILKIELEIFGVAKVWRRISIPGHYTLHGLHLVIQAAMGWETAHLYMFSPKGFNSEPRYGTIYDAEDEDLISSDAVTVAEIFTKNNKKYTYTYDFGDDWTHKISLLKIDTGMISVPSLIDGEGACPPEDCGGAPGYQNLLSILKDPFHAEYEETKEWLGLEEMKVFNPKFFDFLQSEKRVRRIF